MQTNEFYRIAIASLTNIPTGFAKERQVAAAKTLGRTMNPIYVVSTGMNKETFEVMYEIVINDAMAEVAQLAGHEYVDGYIIKVEDVDAVKDLL